jgi:hypothetical protein
LTSRRSKRSLYAGLGASLLAHGAAFGMLLLGGGEPESNGAADPVLLVDIDLAPEPPPAEPPPDQADEPATEPEIAQPAAIVDTTTPAPPDEPDDAIAEVMPDAGLPDGTAIAETQLPDAGVPGADAAMLATVTADAGPSGDSMAVAAVGSDAGVSGDAGTAVASGSNSGEPVRVWSDVDFSPYVPSGDRVSVMMRLDRLRGTEWAERADKILSPMPDYEMIIGDRKLTMADEFEMLLMSSSDPSEVWATTVVGRGKSDGAGIRKFLDNGKSPVEWSTARGGAVGRRTRLADKQDNRVYLMPFPDWVVLARPQHLPKLLEPRTATNIDSAVAKDSDLPSWLAKVRTIEALAGSETEGPAIVVSAQDLPASFEIPRVGKLPGPQRLSMGLEVNARGFLVRGVLEFDSADTATKFERDLEAARKRLLDSYVSRALLLNLHGYNALKGLSLERRGRKISYATSISISDGRAMSEVAAAWAQAFYDDKAAKHNERLEKGRKPPAPRKRGPKPPPTTPTTD